MFSKPFKAVFYILAQAFMTLYKMPADWEPSDEHEEFTGADMAGRPINSDDTPDTGAELPDTRTNVAAQVFTSGADVAAVFQQPVYQMTDKAQGFPRETYLAMEGWTDALLISEGMMVDVTPKPVPPAPPTTPQIASAPVAAVSAPAPATPPAPAPSGSVELDIAGLPWDARIHSGGRTKTDKGAWVKRKGAQAGVVAQVTAELLQNPPKAATPFVPLQAPPAPAAPPVAAAAPTPAPAPPPPATAGEAVAQAKALAAAARNAPEAPSTFQELFQWASTTNRGGSFGAVAQAMGIPSFGMIAQPQYADRIGEAYNIFLQLQPN